MSRIRREALLDYWWLSAVGTNGLLFYRELGFDIAWVVVLLCVISYAVGCYTQTLDLNRTVNAEGEVSE